MTKMVRLCDEHLGYLLDQIEQNEELRQRLHLIVTSDHGMAQINGTTSPIYLEDYLDGLPAKVFSMSSVANVFVDDSKTFPQAERTKNNGETRCRNSIGNSLVESQSNSSFDMLPSCRYPRSISLQISRTGR